MSRPFVVGIMASAPGDIAITFLAKHSAELAQRGIRVPLVILDEYTALVDHPLKERWRIAKRQARIAGCSRPTAMARLLLYRALTARRTRRRPCSAVDFPSAPSVVRVPNLNSSTAIEAIRSAECDLVCLMGARILTAKTLAALRVEIVNIHSSDPGWVRGGPVVIWEVLDGRDHIQLTVHEVVEALDAGAVLASAPHPIVYAGGIGSTTRRTMSTARPLVADLFARVIEQHRDHRAERTPFVAGVLRVTPPVVATVRAEILCRVRSRRGRGGR